MHADTPHDLAATKGWLAGHADTLQAQTTLGSETVVTQALVADTLDTTDR